MAAGLNLQPQRDADGLLKLDLSNQGLTSIPEEVFDITDLEVLDVSNNKLTCIPEAIGRLQKLARLDADCNLLTSLPQAISTLQQLTHLYIYDNQLTEVPPGVCSLPNLEVLSVRNNKLSTLPPGVEKLQKLTHLYIHNNQLTEVPPGVCSLPNLEVFSVSNNKLSTLPPGVENLQKLTKLFITDNQLTEVPPGVCSLPNLEVLVVSNNKLSTLPPGVEKLEKLRELYIHNNQLTEVPPGVCSLPNLEMLSVRNNKLSTFPPGVEKLQKLRDLRINDNQLTEVPPGVCSLPNLEALNVSNNKLSTLPPGVDKLQKLRELYINGNQLTELPPGVCSLPDLEVLAIGPNPIRHLPDDVTRLARLKTLDVHSCQFDEFPRQVLQLKTLEKLYAGGCRFDSVPDELGNLQHLWFLSLDHNLLRTLPSSMSLLHNLRVVQLWNNKFDTFPEVLCELPAMEKLDIRWNNITRLPTALHRADKLKDFDVSGNPLTYPPHEVCEQGTGTIMAFLKQEADEKDERILQAFNRLSVKVKQTQWKPLARSLGLSNRAMDAIKTSAPDDVPDQVYQTLVQWREKKGEAATLSALEQHLRDLDFQQLAEQIARIHRVGGIYFTGHESEVGAVGGEGFDDPQNRYPSVTVDSKFPIIYFERLEEQSILGRGGFAYVKKARHLDWRQDVAVKCLLGSKIEGSEQEVLYSEARKLKLASKSDHVISLLGVCLDPNFAIVMPYMENGSLAGLLRDVDVPWALRWRMAHEISLGMTFLHCQNPQILHCDLKAENVLLDGDFHVKISDFGLSKWKMASRVVTQTSPEGSTITHAPPEYFLDIYLIPTPKLDVYSFGVLLWEIVTRTEPYGNAINSALIRLAVTSGQRPDLSLVPTGLREVDTVCQLMQTCWSQNPEDRPTFQECEDRLRAVTSRSSKEDVLQAIIDVQKMKASAPDDVPDQVYQTLVQWREKEGEAATLPALEQRLRSRETWTFSSWRSNSQEHPGWEAEKETEDVKRSLDRLAVAERAQKQGDNIKKTQPEGAVSVRKDGSPDPRTQALTARVEPMVRSDVPGAEVSEMLIFAPYQNVVFLSYNWDHQDKVLLLHDRLQERGYSCWMDIKQMGGGDSLYEMMDKGIRGAKVVISCVTPPYAESKNCQDEVALARNLDMPIIPVMLEKTTWPPPGPMSIPFAQLIYINMARSQEEDPWKGPLFEELVRMIGRFVKEPKAQYK
ncbi:LRRIQ4 [Branchiostoma lanceolatum]|uniref:Leucine-rich repeat protein SHOC-2 n=1 Tax=Branchiostoma lanceolatum TaxID=7740 RepID=A0A8J9ZAZ0_BRALA|nr:LRRIQ4 [Branchiostoma lanceolatum]